MNLEFVHQEVRQALARGHSQDENIPQKVAQAARWLERNQTMPHMERYAKAMPQADEEGQLVWVPLPAERVKSIEFVRLVKDARQLDHITPRELGREDGDKGGRPNGYWLAAENYLVLDSHCPEPVEIAYNEYTDWPKRLTATNWVIDNAPDFLVAQSMLFFSVQLRDSSMMKFYRAQRDEALRTLLLAQEESEFSNRDMKMRFS